jgi:outer membrane lipoprotein carrier protein
VRRFAGILAATAVTLTLMAATYGPNTAEILERFDRTQQETTTLVARFIEEKHLRLLARPSVSRGRFFFNRPNQVRWEYDDPERKVFVITEDRYVAYYPTEKKAEDVDIKRFVGKRLFRFLALGQSSGELARYYNIARAVDGSMPGTYLLVLTPRRERVRERLAVLRIWIDSGTFLPHRIVYEEPDGDYTVFTFEDARANIDLPERQFRVDLPSDVQISSTFNGLGRGVSGF